MVMLQFLETLIHETAIGRDGGLDLVAPQPEALLADATRAQNLKGIVLVVSHDTERMRDDLHQFG